MTAKSDDDIKKDFLERSKNRTNKEIVTLLDDYNDRLGVNSYFGILEHFTGKFDNGFLKRNLLEITHDKYPKIYNEIHDDVIKSNKPIETLQPLWDCIERYQLENDYDVILFLLIDLYDKDKIIKLALDYMDTKLGKDI